MAARSSPTIGHTLVRLALTGLGAGTLAGVPTAYSMLSAHNTAPTATPSEIEDAPIVETDPGAATSTIGRSADGFFYIDVAAGGKPIQCLVDTGASSLTLGSDAATRLGLHPERMRFDGRLFGATGSRPAARGRLDNLEVGGRRLNNIDATIVRGGNTPCLIGQRTLARLGSIRFAGDELQVGEGHS